MALVLPRFICFSFRSYRPYVLEKEQDMLKMLLYYYYVSITNFLMEANIHTVHLIVKFLITNVLTSYARYLISKTKYLK